MFECNRIQVFFRLGISNAANESGILSGLPAGGSMILNSLITGLKKAVIFSGANRFFSFWNLICLPIYSRFSVSKLDDIVEKDPPSGLNCQKEYAIFWQFIFIVAKFDVLGIAFANIIFY